MMILSYMTCLFAGATPPGQQSTAPWYIQMFPIFLMFVVFYFLLIRPQTKKAKEHEQRMKALKGGMRVMTSSGILGVIITVKEKTVTLRSADAKLEIAKSAISDILEKPGEGDEAGAPPVKS